MKPVSKNSAILRGALVVLAAMLTPIGPALSVPGINPFAVAIASITSGIIALRGYIDQSLSGVPASDADGRNAEVAN